MNDYELLELAAKSIGYEFQFNLANAGQLFKDGDYVKFWDPLTDDGDALRMAVKLRINLTLDDDTNEFYVVANRFDGPKLNNGFIAQESSNGDDFAATRRAIVRAAAEIGRAM